MTDLDFLYQTIEELTPDELNQLYDYVRQKRKTVTWIVEQKNVHQLEKTLKSVHQETQSMSEDEINSLIDTALDEVRRERKDD